MDKAATQEEKDVLKLDQELEKHLAELEDLELKETEKNELKKLLEQQYQDEVADIKSETTEKQIAADIKLTNHEKNTAKIRGAVASALSGLLGSLLGDSLGAKLASIAIDAAIQAGLVKIEGAATAGKISAGIQASSAAAIANPLNEATLGAYSAGRIAANVGIESGLQAKNAIGVDK